MSTYPVFSPASSLAQPITDLTRLTFWLGLGVFLIVALVLGYFMWRYRHRGADGEPGQVFGNTTDEVSWIVAAVLLVAFLLFMTVRVAAASSPATDTRTPDIYVVAHQWYWEFRTPDGAASSGELHIPAGQRVLLDLTSTDVIHDFSAPQLARKIDVIPGQHNRLWIEAAQPGTFSGVCNEFCGPEHAWMRFVVIAEPLAEYRAHQAVQAAAAALPSASNASAVRGAQVFGRVQCGACHQVRGQPSAFPHSGAVGPDLTHFASRRILAGGVLTNTPEHLRQWLRNTQDIKPGARMPTLPLSESEISDLSSYLEALK
ncbi:cytochrome c oxidase subunit II (plasmid) [Deinococcus sp. KNUC1210]|uniref:cytochrome c oxidase subunit II n=1 Tax=Deinococcus sp. KNUC1210 TaxID=2917691 RepID=UPI001EEF84B0|nr:cytochrome c oxidase subunit II [Deinococcus sp. KNUC1210]ULH13869.1 cytochrome c oxidase subunit II [Deinococcus sp. KNUC1210]